MSNELRTAEDLLAVGYENDPFLMEDPSLCSVCSWTYSTNPE